MKKGMCVYVCVYMHVWYVGVGVRVCALCHFKMAIVIWAKKCIWSYPASYTKDSNQDAWEDNDSNNYNLLIALFGGPVPLC